MNKKSAPFVIIGLALLITGGILLFQALDVPPLYPVVVPATMVAETTAPNPGKVNLNTATAEELMTLPGIGPAKAEAILQYRSEYGGFTEPSELLNVKGIGEQIFEKIVPYLTVEEEVQQ